MELLMDDLEKQWRDKVAVPETISVQQYESALKSAIQARSMVTYFIWKELQTVLSKEKSTEILEKAYEKYGEISGRKWGKVENPGQALIAQSSMGGCIIFEQELVTCSEEYAQKSFHGCPHIEAFKELGASDEEIKILCQNILSAGDYGNLIPHKGLTLKFEKQIGNGDDTCEYCIYREQ